MHCSISPQNPLKILNNLLDTLYESEQQSQKVVILTHIPLSDYTAQTVLVRFLRLVLERFKDTITTSLSAHTHNDEFTFYKDSQGKNYLLEFISPSLTTYTDKNPGYRVYNFSNRGEVLDYQQYNFNIDVYNIFASQGNFTFEFDLSYSFLEEYELPTLKSPIASSKNESIDELEDKVLNQDKFSKIYLKHYLTTFTNPKDYTAMSSKLVEAKCRTKDKVDLTTNCITQNGGNYISYIGTYLYRYFFERQKWIIKGKHNPFLD